MTETARSPRALRGGGGSGSPGVWGEARSRPLPAASGMPSFLDSFAQDFPSGSSPVAIP